MELKIELRLIGVLLLLAHPALAAETLDEIVVRADLRERTLSDTPFSVSVMNADVVEAAAIQHFEELVSVVPNMNWSGDGHRARYFQIRGVGELEQYQGAPNPSVGFIIDDIDFSGIGTIATMFDIDSVEVLRGPQGSRYGANALGGLIYVQSATPTADRTGRLQLKLGNDATQSIAAAFGGDLSDDGTTTYRVSAQQYKSDGFRRNAFLAADDSNQRDELSVRARLHYSPDETFSAKAAFLFSDVNNGYDAFALDNSYTTLSDKPGKDAQQSVGASLRLDWQLENGLALTSITSTASSDVKFSFDADWGNDSSWAPFVYDYVSLTDRDRTTLSQELRLGNEKWLVGVYALGLGEEISALNQGDYFDPFFNFADSLNDQFDSEYDATNIALFGQFSHNVGDLNELSAGVRVERRTTDYDDSAGIITGPSETMWGGELSWNRSINDDDNVYVTVSRGFKAGGFNLGPTPAGKRNFDTEIMWTLEAGIKGRFVDDRLTASAAVFHNRRDDQQIRTAIQLIPGDPASFVFFTDNVGEGEATGLEAEGRFIINYQWQFHASIGYLDATIEGGRQQAHAPSYTLAAGVAYQNDRGWFARLDATAKDEFYFDVSHDQRSESYALVNTQLGYDNEDWRFTVWARNLLDEDYAVCGFFFGNEPPNFPNTLYTRFGDPRHYGVTVERRF